jgi:hypothetical protein
MSSRRVQWWKSICCLIPLCAASEALVLGCGGDVAAGELQGELAGAQPALAAGCTSTGAPGAWSNQTFPDQTKRFHVELDATPSASGIDAVIGLAPGGAASFADLAAIVRFNPSGAIDARAGSAYQADLTYPYRPGTQYHIRIDLDVRTHQYSVWVRSQFSSSYTGIAHSYAFRSEQAGASDLSSVGFEADSAAGGLSVCNVSAVADATTADGCVIGTAGDGFASLPLPDATVLDTLAFVAQSDTPNVDAVIGLSAGEPAAFSDLAIAVRFSPAGTIDVRNGSTYAADLSSTYGTSSVAVHLVADITQHRYSVFDSPAGVELARGYQFRTEQSAVSHLDHLGIIVDGTQGHIKVCSITDAASHGIVYSREGSFSVLPLAGDEALLSDGATTTHVDATGHAVASVTRGGALAAAADGNIFIASVSGSVLSVDEYDPAFTPLSHATATVIAGSTISAVATDPSGAVQVGLIAPDTNIDVFRFAGGSEVSELSAPGIAVALDGDQPIIVWQDGATLRIRRLNAAAAFVWDRAFAGTARITAMTVDPNHNVLFGGQLQTPIDFGGGTLPTESNPDGGTENGFVAKLSASGDHVFSRRTDTAEVGAIAANAERVAVSATERTQFHYQHLQVLDATGTPISPYSFDAAISEHGVAGGVAIGPTGRVYWNFSTQWPLQAGGTYLVAIEE